MKNKELITEEEWARRVLEDKIYKVVSFDWEKQTTRVFDTEDEKLYDITGKKIGGKLMLEVVEVE